MAKYLTILLCFLMAPLWSVAQHTDPDDPFKRDPIFNQSLDELFGTGNDEKKDEDENRDTEHFDGAVPIFPKADLIWEEALKRGHTTAVLFTVSTQICL